MKLDPDRMHISVAFAGTDFFLLLDCIDLIVFWVSPIYKTSHQDTLMKVAREKNIFQRLST